MVAGPGRSVPARRRDIGFVPQEGGLFPHLTVAGNVTFGLPRRLRRDAGRVRELLTSSAWTATSPTGRRTSSPAASSSGSPWPARWRPSPRSCCSTSRSPPSTRPSARTPARPSPPRSPRPGPPPSSSPTTRRRRCRWPTRSRSCAAAGSSSSPTRAPCTGSPADLDVATFVGESVVLEADVRDGRARSLLGELALDGAVPTARPGCCCGRSSCGSARRRVGAAARVRSVDFYGHDSRVWLDLPDGATVIARLEGPTCRSSGRRSPSRWSARRCRSRRSPGTCPAGRAGARLRGADRARRAGRPCGRRRG